MAQTFAAWVEAEQGRFALWVPVAMGAAILVYFALPAEPPPWLGCALSCASLIGLALSWRYPPARFFAALALAGALGFARVECRTAAEPPLMVVPSGAVGVSGSITQITLLPQARRITLADVRLDHAPPLARRINLRLRADDTMVLTPGDEISTYAMLFGPDRPAFPGAWDFQRQDFFAGIGAAGFALSPVTITRKATSHALGLALQAMRARIAANILAVLPVSTGSIAVTLLTGDEQSIPLAERQNFIAAGLAHILAVAGLHVGIVMGLVFFTARWLLTRGERLALRLPVKPIAAALSLLAGIGYAALTGAHLPILRSLAMASLVTFGVIIGRRAISRRGLALAALLILLATPEAIIGVSFQMSFSAVLALISGYAAMQGRFAGGGVARHAAALAFTSLLAGGASMPFAAFQFQQIQPYWIPANLVAVPLTAFWIMPLGLLALALMPFGLGALALIPMGWGIGIILWLTNIIAAWPAAMLRIAPMPDAAILLIAFGLIWLCLWRSAPRFAGIAIMLAGLLVYAASRPPDILVSSDARLIAIRDGATTYLIRQPKAQDYTLAAWAPVWAGTLLTPATCSADTCQLGPVLLALSRQASCGNAVLAVSPEDLRSACLGMQVIDRLFVYENGATAAWIHGSAVRLETDRAAQGARPWVVPYPKIHNYKLTFLQNIN